MGNRNQVFADWDENYDDTPAYKPREVPRTFEAPKPRKPSPTPPKREEPVKSSPQRHTISAKPEIIAPPAPANQFDLLGGASQSPPKNVDVFGFTVEETA